MYIWMGQKGKLMDKFIIRGGIPLKGQVTPSGNKNAALPLLAACILTDKPVVLHNIPEINDVRNCMQRIENAQTSILSFVEKSGLLSYSRVLLQPGQGSSNYLLPAGMSLVAAVSTLTSKLCKRWV
jgi:hypothetical protein